jgi:hypothetical protein
MEWEQFHNTGEWRTVKDVSVELSTPMLLSPKLSSGRLHVGSGYHRLLLYLWLSHVISTANSAVKEAIRWLMMGPMEKQIKLEDTSISSSPTRMKTGTEFSLSPKFRNPISPFQPKFQECGLYFGEPLVEEGQLLQDPTIPCTNGNLHVKTRAILDVQEDSHLFFLPEVSRPL